MSEYIKISDIPFRDLAEGHNTDIKVLVAFASDIASLPTIEVSEDADKDEAFMKGLAKGSVEGYFAGRASVEVSEDCISREWLIKAIDNFDWYDFDMIYKVVDNAPSVVPSRAEGEWIRNFDGNEWYWYCTNCKTQWYEEDLWMGGNEFPNYCPNCGADMRGDNDGKDIQSADE